MTSRNYEIKKQVIGEDADLENIGRILNRVTSGVATESRSRRIRDMSGRILKVLELEQRITQRTRVDKNDENNTGSDGKQVREPM